MAVVYPTPYSTLRRTHSIQPTRARTTAAHFAARLLRLTSLTRARAMEWVSKRPHVSARGGGSGGGEGGGGKRQRRI